MDVKASGLEQTLAAELEELRAAGLYRSLRTIASAQGPQITLAGRQYLNFSSNDYLGLANHPRLKEAARAAIERYGVGAGASRLVCGNLEPYARLEEALAVFKKKESAIVFASGYAANVGAICALVGQGDVVIVDKLCHASIIDGCRQSGATLRVYPHKNLPKLEALLRERNGPRTLVITETVYSMDGDLAPLPEIVELKNRYGAWLMIDEAHATGLFGANGRGAAELLGVEDRVEVTMGTLSKAIGCLGGYITGSQALIDYLRNKARSLIYSTALPPSVCAAAAESVRLLATDEGRGRREQLWHNAREMRRALGRAGISVASETAILPIVMGDEQRTLAISQELFARGIFVPAIRYPTVARGKARLRVTVTAAHTNEDIQNFVGVFSELWKA